MSAIIDTNVFLAVAFKDPGWKYCADLLDSVFKGTITGYISSIQFSELYTPFKRAQDTHGQENLQREIRKLDVSIQPVTGTIATLSANYRSSIHTPEGGWLPLADAIILATAVDINANQLYTLDLDFYQVETITVTAPQMTLREWIKKYGTEHQKEVLHLT